MRRDGLDQRLGESQRREEQQKRPHGQQNKLLQPHPPRVLAARLEQKPHGGPVGFAVRPPVQKMNEDGDRTQRQPPEQPRIGKAEGQQAGPQDSRHVCEMRGHVTFSPRAACAA